MAKQLKASIRGMSTGLIIILLQLLLAAALPAGSLRYVSRSAAVPQPIDRQPVVEMIVIGDSTAANYTDQAARLFPLSGWAMFLQPHFDPRAVAVRDVAFPGRSSKSFYDEKRWEEAKATYLSAGDFVFIQFGHNDQKADAARHTEPFTTYKRYLTLYINDTRAAGATPVLVTSISRALWHIDGSGFKQSLGDYPVAMRQLAAELRVLLIDLNQATEDLFTKLGQHTTQNELFMRLPPGKFQNYPNGINDTTHLQVEGAKQVAALAVQGIVKAKLRPLVTHLLPA
ncbi:hypothetical protein L7F22_021715 [Adiantum nelumboides]|nr:hypothetical protein [Adiantum nelumboides]